ncbi:MarR family winged helix-turn-helix transcriptional regulator [Sandarakinorhabdus rubra]|uniref:MarR family winged helix-turn-helix transcriptional regulator n=1 Tax=Sandarakinorhabdus rubra TaxID=2672568 RepID=UPI0013DA1576|nr:MarR family winged helix-turn-helix transcriptional regulator [Sandarakinorhabdus rubra]
MQDSHTQTLGPDTDHPGLHQSYQPAGLTGAAGAVTSRLHSPGGWPAGHVLQQAANALLDGIAGLELRAAPTAEAAGHGAGSSAGHEQAASIARQVADMAQGLAALADRLVAQGGAAATDLAEADCIAFLESQFRIRRLRARHLVGISLGEPAWDILLDLAVAHYWRRETSVTSLCIAADVPSTTALRWINSMTREGLIVRRPCVRDGRRSFLAIAPAGYQAMLALAGDAMRATEKVRARYQRSAA